MTLTATRVDDPQEVSASFTRELSTFCCTQPSASGPGCAAHHGFWPYMRLMGLGKVLSGQSVLYLQAIEALVEQWNGLPSGQTPRVLISGCVDYCMLAHVLHGLRRANRPVAITVLDQCETPLLLNRWYAQRHRIAIDTTCCDIMEYQANAPFDIILTSSFFGYFNPKARQQLFARYAAWLRPAGQLVFANRLRSGSEYEAAVGFNAAQTTQFVEQVVQLARNLPAIAALDEQATRNLAQGYTQCSMGSHPFNGGASWDALVASNGLRIARADRVNSLRTVHGPVSGPTLGDGAEYLFAVLTKP